MFLSTNVYIVCVHVDGQSRDLWKDGRLPRCIRRCRQPRFGGGDRWWRRLYQQLEAGPQRV